MGKDRQPAEERAPMVRPIDLLYFYNCEPQMLDALRAFLNVITTAPMNDDAWRKTNGKIRTDWSAEVPGCKQQRYSLAIDPTGSFRVRSNSRSTNPVQGLIVSNFLSCDPPFTGPRELARCIEVVSSVLEASTRLQPHPDIEDQLGADGQPWTIALAMLAISEKPEVDKFELRLELPTPWSDMRAYDDSSPMSDLAPDAIAKLASTAPLALTLTGSINSISCEIQITPFMAYPGLGMPELSTPTDILRAVGIAARAGTMQP